MFNFFKRVKLTAQEIKELEELTKELDAATEKMNAATNELNAATLVMDYLTDKLNAKTQSVADAMAMLKDAQSIEDLEIQEDSVALARQALSDHREQGAEICKEVEAFQETLKAKKQNVEVMIEQVNKMSEQVKARLGK